MSSVAGVKVYLNYGWESTFGSEATTKDKVFGRGQKLSTLEIRNNLEAVFTLGSEFADKIIARRFEGAWGVDCYLSNPWWAQALFNSVSTSGSGPYEHTFQVSGNSLPKSMTIETGFAGDENVVRKLLGAIVTSATISATVNEIASLRLSGVYKDETLGTSLSSQQADTEEAFTFAQGTVEIPTGTTLAKVQSVEVTINPNQELIYGLGSRKAVAYAPKHYDVSGRVSLHFADADLLKLFYGSSSATTPQDTVGEISGMKLIFTNGLTGTDEREIVIEITGLKFDTHSARLDPTAYVIQDIDFTGRIAKMIATNNTASPL